MADGYAGRVLTIVELQAQCRLFELITADLEGHDEHPYQEDRPDDPKRERCSPARTCQHVSALPPEEEVLQCPKSSRYAVKLTDVILLQPG